MAVRRCRDQWVSVNRLVTMSSIFSRPDAVAGFAQLDRPESESSRFCGFVLPAENFRFPIAAQFATLHEYRPFGR